MKNLAARLQAFDALLAPYAVPMGGILGRPVTEPPDPTRFAFQRDKGRIVHSQSFRRLLGKTQVFVAGEGDHFRTRLTHTMEVAQLARDLARALSLNEDLAECIALAHDLGHPPFGHMGEAALDAWMKRYRLSFEHNEQSLRVVTILEEHAPGAPGLNLQREILEGLQKHHLKDREGGRALSLEAQIVNLADEIAYLGHDCDDGLRAGLFAAADVLRLGLPARALEHAAGRGTSLRGGIIDLLVRDVYARAEMRLRELNIRGLENVYAAREPVFGFSAEAQPGIRELRVFLAGRMYAHPRVLEASEEGQEIILLLCAALQERPTEKIETIRTKTGGALPEAVKDYVAGMTDAYAWEQASGMHLL